MNKAAFIYDPVMSKYVMREDHVLRPSRLQYTFELLDSYGAFQHSRPVKPVPASKDDILSFHTREYVEAVESLSQGKPVANPSLYNLSEWGDNPIFPGMYDGASLSVGGSLKAAEMVAEGEVDAAFNIAGGMHHAAPNLDSGFCIFNDPAIAIHSLL
ncbi:MAG: acetoin utilization protein AcuC, partial [Chloroflexota bacterium]|nr:acetoin utilization protein AcuC [Chloroflexota bacterium]